MEKAADIVLESMNENVVSKCESYVLADSVEAFYNFVLRMMEDKKCQVAIVDEGEEYFEFESGHFFNELKVIFENNAC